jgi:type I restriction enzyme M protein
VNVKQINKLLHGIKSGMRVEDIAKLLYLLKAWKRLSDSNSISKNEITFEVYYNQNIDAKTLQATIEILAKTIKVFELFLKQSINISRLKEDNLVKLFTTVKDEELLTVNDMFYFAIDGMYDFSVSNQIAELGVKLLEDKCTEIYAPFSNGFNYSYYTDKKIYIESFSNEFIAELILIIEHRNIEFTFNNPLESPIYTNKTASHLLKQFDCVLSFPPMGLATNNKFLDSDKFNRFKFHRVKSSRDIAHFEHILAQTKSKAVVLMPVGFTYRASDEAFRKSLIEENILEAVIQLPPNLHNATSIETTLFVIDKNKDNNKVLFVNLKDNSFTKREGRKLILNDIDKIFNIYIDTNEIENISALIFSKDITDNNYSFAIDRYILSKEAMKLKVLLSSYNLKQLDNLVEIRRSQAFKDEAEGREVYELSPSDFAKAGFTTKCTRTKEIGSQSKKLETYRLQPYDVLVSTKGTIGKIGIVGEINDIFITSQAIQVIRFSGDNIKDKAIELYMFFKSNLGQSLLKQLVAGVAMPLISTSEIKQLKIPILSIGEKKQVLLSFNSEIKMYNEINIINKNIKQIHSNFLGTK